MQLRDIPSDYSRIKFVPEIKDVVLTALSGHVNAIIHKRTLKGDFNGLAAKAASYTHLRKNEQQICTDPVYWEVSMLRHLNLTREERTAAEQIKKDMFDLNANLLLEGPEFAEENEYEWHDDAGRNGLGKIRCIYNGAVEQAIYNEDVVQAKPLKKRAHAGSLWTAGQGARTYPLGLGHVWKQRISVGDSNKSFIHKKIKSETDQYRLALEEFTFR